MKQLQQFKMNTLFIDSSILWWCVYIYKLVFHAACSLCWLLWQSLLLLLWQPCLQAPSSYHAALNKSHRGFCFKLKCKPKRFWPITMETIVWTMVTMATICTEVSMTAEKPYLHNVLFVIWHVQGHISLQGRFSWWSKLFFECIKACNITIVRHELQSYQ